MSVSTLFTQSEVSIIEKLVKEYQERVNAGECAYELQDKARLEEDCLRTIAITTVIHYSHS